jgi:microsomal dipeptidase-like Zn-dependent dipeptidase
MQTFENSNNKSKESLQRLEKTVSFGRWTRERIRTFIDEDFYSIEALVTITGRKTVVLNTDFSDYGQWEVFSVLQYVCDKFAAL